MPAISTSKTSMRANALGQSDDSLHRAIALAVEAHAGQFRDDEREGLRLPYIVHPLAVLITLWRWGVAASDTLVAAVLHDTVEDTDVTTEQIEAEFCPRVASIVGELTFTPPSGITREERGRLKHEAYMPHFATASPEALAIKIADRLCNTMDFLAGSTPDYAPVYFRKAEVLFEAMHARLAELGACFGETVRRNILDEYGRVRSVLGICPDKAQVYDETLRGVASLIDGESDAIAIMATVACELHHAFDHFDWTGFYRVVEPGLLKIGPYQGGHGCLTIPFDRGVCGAAARTGETQLVSDVRECPHHIACASSTLSEIVVPVTDREGRLIAVLDIDSDRLAAFDEVDREYLERLCRAIGDAIVQ